MNIHEYQAKAIFKEFGVPVLKGVVVSNPKDAREAAQELGGSVWVVKAQIHAGGRGKGGGVKLAKSTLEVEELTKQILGMTLVTHQTGPEGKLVQKVYIEEEGMRIPLPWPNMPPWRITGVPQGLRR